MKIAFVGVTNLDTLLINNLTDQFDVVVYNNPSPIGLNTKVNLIILDKFFHTLSQKAAARGSQISLPYAFKGLNVSLKAEKPDIILVHDFFRLWFFQALWYRWWHPQVKLIIRTETQRYPHNLLNKLIMACVIGLTRLSMPLVSQIITFTEYGKLFCERRFSVPITCIPIAIDTDLFKPNEPRSYGNPPCLLVVARYVPYKGHLFLLDALKRIESLPWQITFVDATRSDYQRSVCRRAQKLGIDKRIMWDSNRYSPQEMLGVFNGHDILVLPSYGEAIGAVVPEAMACGCATVTSDTVGANTYIDTDKTGYTFKSGNVHYLEDALRDIMKSPQYELFGRRACERMHSIFSKETLIAQFINTISK
jgi:glycosyltransferase involved in cell wall biosynthesis